MTDFAEARHLMVETQLRTRDVTDRRLLAAMHSVPRERFVPEGREGLAYSDMSHDLHGGSGRTLPAPDAFARLVQLATVQPSDVVLDVACGTGYSSAVLAQMCDAVVALEEDAGLAEIADKTLTNLEVGNAAVLKGDLHAGVPAEAPFDMIVVEGAVEFVPDSLLAQLKEGGRLVAGQVLGRTVVATLFVKADGVVTRHESFNISLPRLSAFSAPAEFSL